jgi:hypothetical protein
VIEIEKQSGEGKKVRLFDKIGRPTHFKPVLQISDEEIEKAWKELSAHLFRFNITVGVCSPNISLKELYRFVTEELFEHQMDDINMPGMIHGFIYDEFYPDAIYDNARMAIEDCIYYILCKQPIELVYPFRCNKLRLNNHYPLTGNELKQLVNKFKERYDDLELKNIIDVDCVVNEKQSQVKGRYLLAASTGVEKYELWGDWKVILEPDPEIGNWHITEIYIENLSF